MPHKKIRCIRMDHELFEPSAEAMRDSWVAQNLLSHVSKNQLVVFQVHSLQMLRTQTLDYHQKLRVHLSINQIVLVAKNMQLTKSGSKRGGKGTCASERILSGCRAN
uniref:Uncharacterized protein n=1 Tax=Arundo donax TaxID=35708 RepID=A0A0A9HVR9_ARUDO